MTNPIAPLSRERLEQLADENTICKVSWDERIEMARALLAVMDAKPYGYVHKNLYETCGGAGLSSDHEAYVNSTSHIPLCTTPPAPSAPDYFGELVSKARHSAEKAMIKFPQPNYVLLKVAEEAGEVVQAGVHYAEGRETWEALESEVVQTIAMLYRLVTEGDQVNGVIPPAAPGVD